MKFCCTPLLTTELSLLLRTPQQRLPMLFNGPNNPQKLSLPEGKISTSFNTWFLGPTRVYPLIGISIGSAVFAGLTNVTNRQTERHSERPRYSVCSNTPHLAVAVMRPHNLLFPMFMVHRHCDSRPGSFDEYRVSVIPTTLLSAAALSID